MLDTESITKTISDTPTKVTTEIEPKTAIKVIYKLREIGVLFIKILKLT